MTGKSRAPEEYGRILSRPNCRSIRLKGYDYSQSGAYFITVCTRDRAHLFGEVVAGEMRLNAFGEIVRAAWFDLPNHYNHVRLDTFVIMPNHVHSIIILIDDHPSVGAGVGAGLKPAPTAPMTKRHPLSEIVRGSKRSPPGASTRCVARQARLCGNAIIMSTSFATAVRWMRSGGTSSTTWCAGIWTGTTPSVWRPIRGPRRYGT